MYYCASFLWVVSLETIAREFMDTRVLFIAAVMLASFLSSKVARRRRARNWPVVIAKIEVVSAVMREDGAERIGINGVVAFICEIGGKIKGAYPLAVLTYFYSTPEKQMGEYEKRFKTLEIAQSWAECFKGCLVPVHVNPYDPADSVLLDSDLDNITPCVLPMQPNT